MKRKIKQIFIKTKKNSFNEFVGDNLSNLVGEGFDFFALKEYEPTDDARKIDWLSYAKTNKLFVREFYEEKKLNIVTLALMSGSLYFGTQRLKQQSLLEIIAIIGYSCIKNSDIFKCATLHNKTSTIKDIGSLTALQEELKQLENFSLLGKKIDYRYLTIFLEKQIKQKSIIFIIGDFLDSDMDIIFPKKHEIFVVILRDKFEEEPKPLGSVNIIDPNNNINYNNNITSHTIKKYKAFVKQNDIKLYKTLSKQNIRFTKIYNREDVDFASKLKRLFV